jgi:hypothetical protein
MVVVDGVAYQAKADGSIYDANDPAKDSLRRCYLIPA